MAVSVVSFSFSRAAQPEAHRPTLLGDGFLYFISSAISLNPNSSGVPRAPSAWCGFPYHISSITLLISNCLTSVLTDLYNSSTPTQSPTRSLEWHVWSSSSGNNCHAVHRSLSSGASVYECTMGILACPILLAMSTYAISPHKCHQNVSLPSGASLFNCKFGRVEGQNTTIVSSSLFMFNILSFYFLIRNQQTNQYLF